MKTYDLFGNLIEERPRDKRKKQRALFDDYEGFTEKFKPKKTTDDCYTPQEVYAEVLAWLGEQVDLTGCTIVRPFYPGGDYQSEQYKPTDVVVDNPPFSIISKIKEFYQAHGIRFFLFAPNLTIFSSVHMDITHIACAASVTYENGAVVNTGFVTNMFGDILAMSAPDLRRRIKKAQEKKRHETAVTLPKYTYPAEVLTSSMLGYLSMHDTPLTIRRADAAFIRALDDQKRVGSSLYGHGFLLSEKAAAEKAAAEKAAAEKAAAEKAAAHVWRLSDRERQIIAELSKH